MQEVARWISILGHPFVTATAMVLAGAGRGRGTAGVASSVAIFLLIAVVPIAVLMVRQVRRGAWEHVDASNRRERPTLYIVGISAVLAWFAYMAVTQPRSPWMRELVVTMIVLVLCAILTRWVKVSLHVTIAAFSATTLVIAGSPIGWAVAVLVPLLIWSRLRLSRHKPVEVALGLVIGICGGLALHYPVPVGDERAGGGADALIGRENAGQVQRIRCADGDDLAVGRLPANLA
jgi:hypothetical protein